MMLRLSFWLIASVISTTVMAEVLPRSTVADTHIQVTYYNPNQVYRVTGMQGYTTAIELAPDEKILSANIGDSSSWLVNVQDNIVNIKPITDHPDTNMNLVTTRGTYQFYLTAPPSIRDSSGKISHHPNSRTIFLLRFEYPENKVSTASTISDYRSAATNWKYTAQGNAAVIPVCVFDNGRFTFFDFGARKDIPAIFNVDATGHESLVNYHIQGKYVVVETTGKQFTLRNGNQVASIFNEAPL